MILEENFGSSNLFITQLNWYVKNVFSKKKLKVEYDKYLLDIISKKKRAILIYFCLDPGFSVTHSSDR